MVGEDGEERNGVCDCLTVLARHTDGSEYRYLRDKKIDQYRQSRFRMGVHVYIARIPNDTYGLDTMG